MLFESPGLTNIILIFTALINATICATLLRVLGKLEKVSDKAGRATKQASLGDNAGSGPAQ